MNNKVKTKKATKAIMLLKYLINKHAHNNIQEFAEKIGYTRQHINNTILYLKEVPLPVALKINRFIDPEVKVEDLCPSSIKMKK